MSRIANDNPQNQDEAIKDDIILPFQLQESGLRGRSVRLGKALDDILTAHNYPDAVSLLLADTIALTAALSSMLKYEGIFTLQASGKGAVKTLVSDMDSDGNIRGCATFSREEIDALEKSDDGAYDGYAMADLVGEGYLAFTVDQGDSERYQGIVSLTGKNIMDSVSHYFEQSEQLRTSLYVASRREGDGWRAGALMLQFLPGDVDSDAGVVTFNDKSDADRKEDWTRSKMLLQTCTDDEILAPDMHVNELLRRLFHEEGVIVYDAKKMQKNCRCSQEKVENVINSLSLEDKDHAAKDGKIEMTCEFCSRTYTVNID